jgi:hypothetical protein
MATPRIRRAVPRPVERDEGAAAIGRREARPVIDSQIVGGPVPWEGGDRRLSLRADADRLAAIAAIFRREHQLVLFLVVIALRPAIVGAGDELHQFLSRQVRALRRRVEARLVLKELIPTVLGREQAAAIIEGEALTITQTGHKALLGRKDLSGLVGA